MFFLENVLPLTAVHSQLLDPTPETLSSSAIFLPRLFYSTELLTPPCHFWLLQFSRFLCALANFEKKELSLSIVLYCKITQKQGYGKMVSLFLHMQLIILEAVSDGGQRNSSRNWINCLYKNSIKVATPNCLENLS